VVFCGRGFGLGAEKASVLTTVELAVGGDGEGQGGGDDESGNTHLEFWFCDFGDVEDDRSA
jgi:hypothetical protein